MDGWIPGHYKTISCPLRFCASLGKKHEATNIDDLCRCVDGFSAIYFFLNIQIHRLDCNEGEVVVNEDTRK
jgi:hypothetical protein